MNCSKCGFANPSDTKFCRNCGEALGASPSSIFTKIQSSLNNLGLPVSAQQIKGVLYAVAAGMIVSHIVVAFILPAFWAYIFNPILTPIFGAGVSSGRDLTNKIIMAMFPFMTSFAVAFFISRVGRSK